MQTQDPFAAKIGASPYEVYGRLRQEKPVYWSPTLRAWVLTRMQDVKAVLDEDGVFPAFEAADNIREISRRSGRDYAEISNFLDATLFLNNGENHLRDRRTLAKVVNRIPLSKLRTHAVEIANDQLARLSGEHRFDFIADFAAPLPQRIMALILGVPQSDVSDFDALLADATLIFDPALLDVFDRVNGRLKAAHALMAKRIQMAYLSPEPSGLKTIYEAAPGGPAARLRLATFTALFIFRVGAETTIGLLGLLAKALMDDPQLFDQLRGDPVLVEAFVAEVLRLESNVQRSMRVARQTREIGGETIETGQRVILMLGAANRDPEAVRCPDAIGLSRPSEGVAFGHGLHYCLGAALAKMEGVITVEALLRLGAMQQDGPEVWFQGSTIRRLSKLPARLISAPVSMR